MYLVIRFHLFYCTFILRKHNGHDIYDITFFVPGEN